MRKSGPYFGASSKTRRLLRKETVKYRVGIGVDYSFFFGSNSAKTLLAPPE